jgi:transcriptional regulator with XRE-family HTH domain
MKNNELARRIKELRNRNGFSQEELSGQSGLSLRTIQRIENGETEPRGDSLKRLASVFNLSPDEIIDFQITEDKRIVNLLNLSQLSFLAIPVLGFLIPLIIWISQKDKIKNVDKIGKSIINFQVTWTIVFFGTFLICGIDKILKLHLPLTSLGPLVLIIPLYIINLVVITANSVRAFKLKEVWYQPSLRFIK